MVVCRLKAPAHPSRQARVMDLAFYFSLTKTVTMFSWVRVLDGAGASWEVREKSSRIFSVVWSSFSSLPLPFTLYFILRSSSFVWRPTCTKKKYSRLTSLTNSKLEFVSAKTASWNCCSDFLANFTVPTDFFLFFYLARTSLATCEFIPIKCHSPATGIRELLTSC